MECLNAHFFGDRADAVLVDYLLQEKSELFEFVFCCCRSEADIVCALVSVKRSYDVDGFVHYAHLRSNEKEISHGRVSWQTR